MKKGTKVGLLIGAGVAIGIIGDKILKKVNDTDDCCSCCEDDYYDEFEEEDL